MGQAEYRNPYVLKQSFIPFVRISDSENPSKKSTLLANGPYFMNKGIELVVTNSLGYNPIRSSNEEIKDSKDLREHLAKMDDAILGNKQDFDKSMILGLAYLSKDLGKELQFTRKILSEYHEEKLEVLALLKDWREEVDKQHEQILSELNPEKPEPFSTEKKGFLYYLNPKNW